MKKLIFITLCLFAFAMAWQGCKKDIEEAGSIHGIVTDKATGEPVKNAGVELKPLGSKTVTGSEGQYEFTEVKAGEYTLFITKTGYTDFTSSTIIVNGGQQTQTDVQIERLPASLRIVNDDGQDINELDFGDQESVVAKSFNIFNGGTSTLNWQITKTADWIESTNLENGTLNAGVTQGIIVIIDRSKLINGENVTTLHITSNDGNRQLTIKATGISDVVTLEPTEVTETTAVLNGQLVRLGNPAYTEMGFVYGTMPTPSLDNGATIISIQSVQVGNFSSDVSDLGGTGGGVSLTISPTSMSFDYSASSKTCNVLCNSDWMVSSSASWCDISTLSGSNNGSFLVSVSANYASQTRTATVTVTAGSVSRSLAVSQEAFNGGGSSGDEFYYDFEGGTANDWHCIDADGDGYVWYLGNSPENTGYAGSTYCVFSESFRNDREILYPDNYLVSKKVTIGNSSTLSFYVCAQDASYAAEHYGVAISTTGNSNASDFTTIWEETLIAKSSKSAHGPRGSRDQGSWYHKSVDLSSYSGQQVYIALRHFGCSDMFQIVVDNIKLSNGSKSSSCQQGFNFSNLFADTDKKTNMENYASFGDRQYYDENTDNSSNSGTTYYVRAYAKNASKTVYGGTVSFVTGNMPYVVLQVANLMVQAEDLGYVSWDAAMSMCDNSIVAGFTDWRLPTKDELMVLYNNRDYIGGFTDGYYWSSTLKSNSTYVWSQHFYGGSQLTESPWNENHVRAVRTIQK